MTELRIYLPVCQVKALFNFLSCLYISTYIRKSFILGWETRLYPILNLQPESICTTLVTHTSVSNSTVHHRAILILSLESKSEFVFATKECTVWSTANRSRYFFRTNFTKVSMLSTKFNFYNYIISEKSNIANLIFLYIYVPILA